jgi:two-component system, sensor histidine kinase
MEDQLDNQPTLLIIEDNETQQFVLKALCEKFDYDAHIVSSGEEALSALACAHFTAILMDIALGGMDGFECTRRIREIESRSKRRTPIIAVTAHADDKHRCLAAGMDDFISKPFEIEEFRLMLLRNAYQPAKVNLKLLRGYVAKHEESSSSNAKYEESN